MTKEEFIKIGLDAELAGKAAAASAEELKGYVAKARFDEISAAKTALEEDTKARDKQLDALKKSTGDAEALKAQITKLQEDNKAAQIKYEARIRQMQIDGAVEKALAGAKAKNIKAVRALLDLEKAELDGEEIKGLAEQIKRLQTADDSKFLFDAEPAANKIVGMAPPASADPGQARALSAGAQYAAVYNAQFEPATAK